MFQHIGRKCCEHFTSACQFLRGGTWSFSPCSQQARNGSHNLFTIPGGQSLANLKRATVQGAMPKVALRRDPAG
jgi:hypothetical protein